MVQHSGSITAADLAVNNGYGGWVKDWHGNWRRGIQSYQHGSGAGGRSTGTLQEVVVSQGNRHKAEGVEKVKSGTMVGLKKKDHKEEVGRAKGEMVAHFGEHSTVAGLHTTHTMMGSHGWRNTGKWST